jgi:hypothetical protein
MSVGFHGTREELFEKMRKKRGKKGGIVVRNFLRYCWSTYNALEKLGVFYGWAIYGCRGRKHVPH